MDCCGGGSHVKVGSGLKSGLTIDCGDISWVEVGLELTSTSLVDWGGVEVGSGLKSTSPAIWGGVDVQSRFKSTSPADCGGTLRVVVHASGK